jgi:hypothetical protein
MAEGRKATLDFRGYFHMDELVRKTGRELSSLGFDVEEVSPTVLKTSIGTNVGTWSAWITGEDISTLNYAGFIQGIFSRRGFGSEIRGRIAVKLVGEGYEDFRRKDGIPFFTTASVMISGETFTYIRYGTLDKDLIVKLGSKPHTYTNEHLACIEWMEQRIGEVIETIAARMNASSFSRQCQYCKSMFIEGTTCQYCGAPVEETVKESIIADRKFDGNTA